jgi:hypothetical protein
MAMAGKVLMCAYRFSSNRLPPYVDENGSSGMQGKFYYRPGTYASALYPFARQPLS